MKKIFFFFLFSTTIVANAQWVSQTSGTIDNFNTVFFPSPNIGYISSNGYLLKTINGGSNWNPLSGSGIGGPLYFTSIDTGYTTGLGGILKTVDGGLTWIDNFPFTNIYNCSSIHFPTSSIGYAIGQNAALDSLFTYKTINAGSSWVITNSFPSYYYEPGNIFFSDPLTGSLILYGSGIYKTIDGGVSWVPKLNTLSAENLRALHFPSSTVGYAVGGDSTFKTTDIGETWLPIAPPPSSIIYNAVYFTALDTGFAAGGNGFSTGGIMKTFDGGITWTLSNTNPYTFQSLHFANSNTGYACGQSGVIYKYSPTAGINNPEEIMDVSVFPNPNTGKFKLSIEKLIIEEMYQVSVLDILGNTIQETELNSSTTDFDISMQAKGIYFVKIETKKGKVMKKIIVE